MASQQQTVDFVLEQIGGAGTVSAKKMFGEYGIYCGGKMVAMVCDDLLYVKPTSGGKEFILASNGKFVEGAPYPGAKPCLLISGDLWEDREWLSQLIKISTEELPISAPKKKPRLKSK